MTASRPTMRDGRRGPILIGLVAAIVVVAAFAVAVAGRHVGSSPSPSGIVTDTPHETLALTPSAASIGSTTPTAAAALPCAGGDEPTPTADQVLVFFVCEHPPNDPRPVVRIHPGVGDVEVQLHFALEQLLAGPTQEEQAAGYSSPFPADSEKLLIGLEVTDHGHAIVDFAKELTLAGPLNASTPRFMIFSMIGATIRQFEAVDGVEFRIEGSCEEFSRYFEATCSFVRERDGLYGDWLLTLAEIDGRKLRLSWDMPVSLVLEPTELRGETPCNVYGAQVEISGDAIDIGNIVASEAGCESREAAEIESVYLGALARVSTVTIQDADLALTGDDVRLHFAELSAVLPGE